MKLSMFAAIALFSISGLTHHDPITQFTEGEYLGEGKYATRSGHTGTFSSHAIIGAYDWSLSYVRDGHLTSYELFFDFEHEGFFEVQALDYNSGIESVNFGDGHCSNTQCHFAFSLDNERYLEETITFEPDENRIYTLGSLLYKDADGNDQKMVWQNNLFLMNFFYDQDSD